MADLLDHDATDLMSALNARRVSAVDLLKMALARHAATHHRLNAVVAVDLERSFGAAKAVDDLRARGGAAGLLAGLPITVKDTLDVAGLPASSGLASFRRRRAEDAACVSHVRRAGAVIWGKTNTPAMASDWQTSNRLYGTTNNPWDAALTSGGSSGGAAAVLAARVAPLEIGSDVGGSLRIPASFCGVFAHKPTWGLVDQYGHVPPRPGSRSERDLNVIGPMARSARDLRLLLSVMSAGPMPPKGPPATLKGARIGLWLDEPTFSLDPECHAVLTRFAADLEAAGATVTPIPSPVDAVALMRCYQTLLYALASEDLPPAALRRMELLRGPAKLALRSGDPQSWAAAVMGFTARHREWLAADAIRERLRHGIAPLFDRFDAILAPASPVTAFPHDRRPMERRKLVMSDGKSIDYRSLLTWVALPTALKLPATVVPAGLTEAGLPVGAQLIGASGADSRLLALAQAIDEDVRGFTPPPIQRPPL